MKRRQRIKKYFYTNKVSLAVYLVLRTLVIISMLRSFFRDDYESVFLCGLTLVLLILPSLLAKSLKLELPGTFEVIVLMFIFSAEILGEINNFYIKVPYWDDILHTMNGFLCAALGFALVDMMNREERFTFQLSPAFLAVVAFCFSMTVGVLWEFFEFSCDQYLALDMQKDTIVNTINTVSLDSSGTNRVIRIEDIADVIIVHSDGSMKPLELGGYLDIGIVDTMHDLFVNLIGASIFALIGYSYLKLEGRGTVASSFIPKVADDEEDGESGYNDNNENNKEECCRERIKCSRNESDK